MGWSCDPRALFHNKQPLVVPAAHRTMGRLAAATLAFAALVALVAATTVKLDGGRAGAEIIWDSWGVPHIYADNYEVLVRSDCPCVFWRVQRCLRGALCPVRRAMRTAMRRRAITVPC